MPKENTIKRSRCHLFTEHLLSCAMERKSCRCSVRLESLAAKCNALPGAWEPSAGRAWYRGSPASTHAQQSAYREGSPEINFLDGTQDRHVTGYLQIRRPGQTSTDRTEKSSHRRRPYAVQWGLSLNSHALAPLLLVKRATWKQDLWAGLVPRYAMGRR